MDGHFQEKCHLWQMKIQMAKEGNIDTISYIKQLCSVSTYLSKFNLQQILSGFQLKNIHKQQTYSQFQIYNQIPICIVVEGVVSIQCIDSDGVNQTICTVQSPGILQVNSSQLQDKFGMDGINMLTGFNFYAHKDSLLMHTGITVDSNLVTVECLSKQQKAIINKYLVIPLKYINKFKMQKQGVLNQPVYLLEGRAYYYQMDKKEQKTILCCYEEGYLNPQAQPNFKLYIQPNSVLIQLDKDFIRDDYVKGIQAKRQQHLQAIATKYLSISPTYKMHLQQALLLKYAIINVAEKIQKKPIKSGLRSTNTSIKRQKCNIRIRKKKKLN